MIHLNSSLIITRLIATTVLMHLTNQPAETDVLNGNTMPAFDLTKSRILTTIITSTSITTATATTTATTTTTTTTSTATGTATTSQIESTNNSFFNNQKLKEKLQEYGLLILGLLGSAVIYIIKKFMQRLFQKCDDIFDHQQRSSYKPGSPSINSELKFQN